MNTIENQSWSLSGLFTLSIRWVIGWTYFSAFWRRLILENKLIPEEAGYIGEKFNHFLPNALGIKPIIEYLVSNPDALQISMVAFTIVEAIVGLFIILGLFTRLMSVGVFFLASGILLGSGWLGTTCLDEWQIGVLGLAGGFTMFLTGSGSFSLDYYMIKKNIGITTRKWFSWLGSGMLPIAPSKLKYIVLTFSIFLFGVTLATNQIFHGGVWGTLHNMSVRPIVEISNPVLTKNDITFQLYRVEGADVYGSFLIEIQLLDKQGKVLKSIGMSELSDYPLDKISNHYVAKIKPGIHSLIIPLGAKADFTVSLDNISSEDIQTIQLIDISGAQWQLELK